MRRGMLLLAVVLAAVTSAGCQVLVLEPLPARPDVSTTGDRAVTNGTGVATPAVEVEVRNCADFPGPLAFAGPRYTAWAPEPGAATSTATVCDEGGASEVFAGADRVVGGIGPVHPVGLAADGTFWLRVRSPNGVDASGYHGKGVVFDVWAVTCDTSQSPWACTRTAALA